MPILRDLLLYVPRWLKFLCISFPFLVILYSMQPTLAAILRNTHHIASSDPSAIDRLRASREYLRYSIRKTLYDGPDSENPPLKRYRANILGLDASGRIHLNLYTLQGKVKTSGLIADIVFSDLRAVNALVMEDSEEAVVADIYTLQHESYFVLWLKDGTPINETLILHSLAVPIDTPKTNIDNTLFKRHYERIIFE